MKVKNHMTSNPITVQHPSLPDAINIMATKGIGNLIVSSSLVGLLTERDL